MCTPLQELTQEMPRGERVNPASDSEHVTEIERQILVSKEMIRSIKNTVYISTSPLNYF